MFRVLQRAAFCQLRDDDAYELAFAIPVEDGVVAVGVMDEEGNLTVADVYRGGGPMHGAKEAFRRQAIETQIDVPWTTLEHALKRGLDYIKGNL